MITQQHKQEYLSKAYIQALSAMAGMSVSIDFGPDYGFDGAFSPIKIINGKRRSSASILLYQAKASSNWATSKTAITYPLEVDTYNHLSSCYKDDPAPIILILMCIPEDFNECFSLSEEHLALSKACYWYQVKGNISSNTSSVTISIPLEQRLTPHSLRYLCEKARGGKEL